MRILLAQINPTIGDLPGNTQKIVRAIKHGRKHSADIILLPELALTGYPPQDLLLLPDFIDAFPPFLDEIMDASEGIIAIVGMPRKNPEAGEKHLFNSAAVIENKTLIGFQDKVLLPTYDVFDEKRYFEAGGLPKIWDLKGKSIAITICEDIWKHSDLIPQTSYRRDPVMELMPQSPEFVLNLSASPYSISKIKKRIAACAASAKTLKCPLILCNQVGGNDSLIFDGYSSVIDSTGNLVKLASGFEEDFLIWDSNQTLPAISLDASPVENLYNALVLGIRDYFHKSKFSKACLGISGGIDSAVVACLAVEALGSENVLGLCLPSRYSSEESYRDASMLIRNLNIEEKVLSIEAPFQSYLDLLSPFFEGKESDATEENLQARIRGMLLMAFSNKFGYIVLSTGNKSELAMGYSTLYGDMCGGLAVLNDVTKEQVYALASWINRSREIIPSNTIHRPPSAELRPNQKDSDTLPPYEVLDRVIQEYIEEHRSAEYIAKKYGYSYELVADLIKRIHNNEYKRRQSPPGLRVSEKAFSVGRHFPIVQRYK
jgi:NAD+ synthase (glutamine-hydrolysing)